MGFILLVSLIWARFIYKRFPRDIPFNLSIIGLLIVLIVCIFYMYKIYTLFRPRLPSHWIKLLKPIIIFVVKPLLQFNHLLLSKEKIRHIIKLLLRLTYQLFELHLPKHNRLYIYALSTIIPQIIFTICLIIDCFYFKELYLIYTCVLLITFPLIIQYLISISEIILIYDTKLLDEYFIIEITSKDIQYLASDWDDEGFLKPNRPVYFIVPSALAYSSYDVVYEYNYIKTKDFIDYQATSLICDSLLYEYKILFQEERKDVIFLEKISLPVHLTKEKCNELLQFHINISLLKDEIESSKNNSYVTNYFFKLHLLINIIALICWGYILVISLHTLHFSSMELFFIQNFFDTIEPFSNTSLF